MKHLTKILFNILLAFTFNKGTFSIHLSESISMEYDITKKLDSCVTNMFNDVDSFAVWNELFDMKKYKLDEFNYKVDFKSENFRSRVSFRDVTFQVTNCMFPEIDWNFSENKMRISVEKLFFNALGTLHVTKNESYPLHTQINLLNATINIMQSSKTATTIKLSITQDSYSMLYGKLQNYFWSTNEDENKIRAISDDRKNTLNLVILEALPLMLTEYLNQHQIFEKAFKSYSHSKNPIISTYPDFLSVEHQFYYLIPRFPFFHFYFKLIVIKGLSNFKSMQVRSTKYPFTHTLLLENIQGRMYLDYGTMEEKPLELTFGIDYLTISINKETNCVNANARYYQINGTNGPLTYRQSPIIMQAVESAIASSVMPSMKVERTCDVKILEQQIQVTQTSDWKTMKKLYKKWIPFNEEDA